MNGWIYLFIEKTIKTEMVLFQVNGKKKSKSAKGQVDLETKTTTNSKINETNLLTFAVT